jgi:hypothetical protein
VTIDPTSWLGRMQQERMQRQQAMAERQQQVREALTKAHQERAQQSKQSMTERHQFQQSLAMSVSDFLEETANVRMQTAVAQKAALQEFQGQLQQDVQELMTDISTDRIMMAQKLVADLTGFHSNLVEEVSQLLTKDLPAQRKEMKAHVAQIQKDTQNQLTQNRKQRAKKSALSVKERAEFVDNLQAEVSAMRADAQEFMVDVQDESMQRKEETWGTKSARPARTKKAKPAASKAPQKAPAPAKSAAPKAAPAKQAKAISVENSALSVPHEKEVYDYVQNNHGARLAQIEETLGISRFQAVDALRSLLDKGILVKRDRDYLTQEDSSR